VTIESLFTAPGDRLDVVDDFDAINELFHERGWTDGLPIVPPTVERVERMLAYCDRPWDDVTATLAPRYGAATPLRIAANAVMAGCQPEYFPVIMTVVEALAAEPFNLYAIQTTTHQCAPLTIVNGPIARELGINGARNAFGQGTRANASIGRAVRFLLLNVGGGVPGTGDMATFGQPAKYTYCVAEHEAASPWAPLHVERGFPADTSTVTVVGGEGPHNINDHGSTTAAGILTMAAGTVAITGSNNVYYAGEPLIVLGPEHAATIARDGFTKADVQRYLYEHARVPLTHFSRENLDGRLRVIWSKLLAETPGDARLPVAQRPEDFLVVVIGGPGKHSAFIPTFGATRSVTRAIRLASGRPAASVRDFVARSER
jgi:hypothetical protein